LLLTGSDLERVLAEFGVAAPVRADEVTGSTNETALAMAEAGAPEWTLVAAGHQTGGRGRLGRVWEDVPGRAVLLSVLLRPAELPAERAGVIPLLAGIAMTWAIRRVTGLPARCKWPNDLLVEGGKVGGILVESRIADERVAYAVIGVGVNLDAPALTERASGLGEAHPVALIASFLHELRARYPAAEGALDPGEYEEVCATIGREVAAVRVDGRRIVGRAIGVSLDGALLLETDEGPASVASGEVLHLDG
jgi:BirA family transcriptional regulator, biotin operon repressor / biotin---[acetyl-CoA-carboxylase] ligase